MVVGSPVGGFVGGRVSSFVGEFVGCCVSGAVVLGSSLLASFDAGLLLGVLRGSPDG